MKKAPLIVAGIIFACVALLHLARIVFQFPIVIDNYIVPLKANVIGFIVATCLSLWMFIAAKKS